MSRRAPTPRLQSALEGSTVLGLSLSGPVLQQIMRTLPEEVSFQLAKDITELVALSDTASAPMLTFELYISTAPRRSFEALSDPRDCARCATLRTLPSVALCHTDHISVFSELREFEHVQIVAMEAHKALEMLWHAFELALASSIATSLLKAIGHIGLPLVRRVMTVSLSRAGRDLQVPEVAAALHMHERTLRRRLRAETGGMSVQTLIGWARILRVAWQLEQPARSTMDIANALTFSAASNLHRQVLRYTGYTVRALQTGEPVATAVRCFRDAIGASEHPNLVSKGAPAVRDAPAARVASRPPETAALPAPSHLLRLAEDLPLPSLRTAAPEQLNDSR